MSDKLLIKVLEDLKYIDAEFVADGVAKHYIELIDDGDDSFAVAANVAGLVHLAKMFVSLAVCQVEGKHYHLDELGIVDRCDRSLIMSYKKAVWD
ncbi:MAG: hypothetical protein Tsb002_34310 [Wenzhouxiangellaceae bacterium]